MKKQTKRKNQKMDPGSKSRMTKDYKYGFWTNLPHPFFGLSPMDGVTDLPFRLITKKYGNPDVLFTEFVPVEALIRGIERAFIDLGYDESERPIIAQLYGHQPELFYSSAQIVCELGFDGIDINMGCPAKKIEQRGAGAGLIRNPEIAAEIIRATKEGVSAWVENGIEWDKMPSGAKVGRLKIRLAAFHNPKLTTQNSQLKTHNSKPNPRHPIPVSVKTRIGYDRPVIKEWFSHLAEQDIAAISIHGRTLRQAYRGKADWNSIAEAVQVIKADNPKTIVIGNGDINSYKQGLRRIGESKVDGVLVGRAAIGNPWVFTENYSKNVILLKEVMVEHSRLHWELKDQKAFVQMRRNFAEYIKGFEGAKELRAKLVRTNNPEEVSEILEKFPASIAKK